MDEGNLIYEDIIVNYHEVSNNRKCIIGLLFNSTYLSA